jgi:uncharacterized protein (TIGR02246 family)
MTDEQKIRDLIATWIRASNAGDSATVLKLMSEDVVFLMPGMPPMRGREAFAAASCAAEGKIKMDAHSDVQEIQVFGDVAYCWTRLSLTITPLPSGTPTRRSGYTLSILRKTPEGNWILTRDANMLTPES